MTVQHALDPPADDIRLLTHEMYEHFSDDSIVHYLSVNPEIMQVVKCDSAILPPHALASAVVSIVSEYTDSVVMGIAYRYELNDIPAFSALRNNWIRLREQAMFLSILDAVRLMDRQLPNARRHHRQLVAKAAVISALKAARNFELDAIILALYKKEYDRHNSLCLDNGQTVSRDSLVGAWGLSDADSCPAVIHYTCAKKAILIEVMMDNNKRVKLRIIPYNNNPDSLHKGTA